MSATLTANLAALAHACLPPPLAFIDGVGGPEMLLVLVLVLVLFGGKKMPEFARGLGRTMRELKKATAGVEEEIKRAMEEEPPKPPPPALPEPPDAPVADLKPADATSGPEETSTPVDSTSPASVPTSCKPQ